MKKQKLLGLMQEFALKPGEYSGEVVERVMEDFAEFLGFPCECPSTLEVARKKMDKAFNVYERAKRQWEEMNLEYAALRLTGGDDE